MNGPSYRRLFFAKVREITENLAGAQKNWIFHSMFFFSKEALLMSGLFYAAGSSYCFLAVPFAPDTMDISGLCGGGKQPVTDNTLCEIR